MRMSPAVVAEKPQFAIFIALVASHWSKLEQNLGIAYTYLLAGEEPSAFEFFHDLVDLKLRESAFMAAAKSRLPQSESDEITRLFGDIRKTAKARAAVIHGTWCSLETKPLSIFLAEPRDVGKKINDVFAHLRRVARKPEEFHPSKDFSLSPDNYIEYKPKDFQDILDRLIQLDVRAEQIGKQILARSVERASKLPD